MTARGIRDAVLAATRLSVSVGGGTSKVVAKLAAGVAKPSARGEGSGVHIVGPGHELEFMRQFALAVDDAPPASVARETEFTSGFDQRVQPDILNVEFVLIHT